MYTSTVCRLLHVQATPVGGRVHTSPVGGAFSFGAIFTGVAVARMPAGGGGGRSNGGQDTPTKEQKEAKGDGEEESSASDEESSSCAWCLK